MKSTGIYFFCLVVMVFLSGCASNSGVVTVEKDTYMVTRQAATGFSGSGTLKADAIKEAEEFCKSKGLVMKIVAITEAEPPYLFGNFPKAEVVFKALSPGNPELETPTTFDPYHVQIKAGQKPSDKTDVSKTSVIREESDSYDKLLKLNELKEKGILTEEEFQTEKAKILNSTKD